MRFLPENNLAYPVLIKTDNGACGSGFFLSSKGFLYLVTAKHVLVNHEDEFLFKDKFTVTAYSQSETVKDPILISITASEVKDEIKKHPSADIVVIKIGEIVTDPATRSSTANLFKGITIDSCPKGATIVWVSDELFKKYEDVFISNDIYILGYPVSVGQKGYEQIDPNRPLIRKGIVAGKNEKKGTIILDSAVYFGNSGGLVLEVNIVEGRPSVLPIGIVSEYIPFVEELYSLQHKEIVTINRANSSYSVAVPIDKILDLI